MLVVGLVSGEAANFLYEKAAAASHTWYMSSWKSEVLEYTTDDSHEDCSKNNPPKKRLKETSVFEDWFS